MDDRSVRTGNLFAYAGGDSGADEEHDCPYCGGGVVFLSSFDEDGFERYDVLRCRKCRGSGVL